MLKAIKVEGEEGMAIDGAMKVVMDGVKPISRSFLNYLHLGTWLDMKVTSLLSGRSVNTFTSVESFWRHISEERLSAGDRIRFKGAFLTEWVPRSPGGAWFHECLRDGSYLDTRPWVLI